MQKMKREVVRIDEEKCTGCGLCVPACAEGAIQIIEGKARLVSESYCDGLGACLGECPEGAIRLEEREAEPFDEAAVQKAVESCVKSSHEQLPTCPGLTQRVLEREPVARGDQDRADALPSRLGQWPVQLALVSPDAPYLKGADLLLVADCVPFALAGFHDRFLCGRAVAIGCPKLDDPKYYAAKLTEIVRKASPRRLTVAHMEVPCCSGLTHIAETALAAAGADIIAHDVTVGIDGQVLAEEVLAPESSSADRDSRAEA